MSAIRDVIEDEVQRFDRFTSGDGYRIVLTRIAKRGKQ